MAWLLLTHGLALALLAYAPFWWIKRDAADFARNPADDSYHGVFHRQRATWRAAFTMVVAGAASLPMVSHPWYCFALSMGGLLAIGTGWFAYVFNPGINRARNLPYVGPYYVSPDPRAAFFPDRLIWNRSAARAKAFLHGFGTARDNQLLAAQYAAATLRHLLMAALIAGCLIYAAAVAGLLLL
ncbi:hypothetical protein [Hymenobacter ruber]